MEYILGGWIIITARNKKGNVFKFLSILVYRLFAVNELSFAVSLTPDLDKWFRSYV